jgi:hypothetical protein
MLNEQKQTRPNCKVEATQMLLAIYGERMWEKAAPTAKLQEMKDCA